MLLQSPQARCQGRRGKAGAGPGPGPGPGRRPLRGEPSWRRVRLFALAALAIHASAGGAFAGLPSGARAQRPFERHCGVWRGSTAEGGRGEIQLRGLKIKSVDKKNGIITLVASSPTPAPPATKSSTPASAPEPKKSSPDRPAPGTEVEGVVTFIGKSKVMVQIDKFGQYTLNTTTDMANKLRSGERLALLVQSARKRTVALRPAVEEELAGRAASRKPLAELEVGTVLDGFVKRVQAPYGIFVDIHCSTDALARFRQVDTSVKGTLKIGALVRVNVTQVSVEEDRVGVAILAPGVEEEAAA